MTRYQYDTQMSHIFQIRHPVKWRALLGLLLVWASAVAGMYWVWGAILVWWAVSDMRYGDTWFMESVRRSANPIVFWLIVITWLGFGAYLLSELLLQFQEI